MTNTLITKPAERTTTPRSRHCQLIVDVHLLLLRDGQILLGKRANTGYGDGAYEPPSSRLDERETIVEAAVRVAAAQAGIELDPARVSLAHVMHDVSGAGRIAFFLTADGWDGDTREATASYSDLGWFPLTALPANMIDRARVAVRDFAAGARFSTYPAFGMLRLRTPSSRTVRGVFTATLSTDVAGEDPWGAQRDLRGAGHARVVRLRCRAARVRPAGLRPGGVDRRR